MPHNPITNPDREVLAEFLEGGDEVVEVGGHDGRGGIAAEGVEAGEAVIVEAAHGIHVGALIEGIALELLGCHEVDGAEDGVAVVDGLEGGLRGEFGEAEVDDLDLEFAAGEPDDHEVGGFEVAVASLRRWAMASSSFSKPPSGRTRLMATSRLRRLSQAL